MGRSTCWWCSLGIHIYQSCTTDHGVFYHPTENLGVLPAWPGQMSVLRRAPVYFPSTSHSSRVYIGESGILISWKSSTNHEGKHWNTRAEPTAVSKGCAQPPTPSNMWRSMDLPAKMMRQRQTRFQRIQQAVVACSSFPLPNRPNFERSRPKIAGDEKNGQGPAHPLFHCQRQGLS